MTSQAPEIRVACDWERRLAGGLAELVPFLAHDADLGAFRLAYAAGQPSAGALQAAGVRCTEHGSPPQGSRPADASASENYPARRGRTRLEATA